VWLRRLVRRAPSLVIGLGIGAIAGADIITNAGRIIISSLLPMTRRNPSLDPYSPERRFG
jgi:hypothetical protein